MAVALQRVVETLTPAVALQRVVETPTYQAEIVDKLDIASPYKFEFSILYKVYLILPRFLKT